MKDVHAMVPRHPRLGLHRVGIEGVRKPLLVERSGRVITLTTAFSLAVDLPSDRKGSDLSRNAELLADQIDWPEARPVPSLESVCASIARELLVRHPYATRSEVRGTAEYFLSRGIAPGRESLENFTLLAEGRAHREGSNITVRRLIGAEAVGMTACPCAMETARDRLVQEFPALGAAELKELPIVTHNQRNRTSLTFEVTDDVEVEADRIIDAIEAAQSSPTYAILKRGDEARLVLDAHRHPKFVEDVLRDLLASVPQRFPMLSGDSVVRVRTVSEESIHKYDVVADHETTVGELRSSNAST
ncbi:MAG: GTP cyclohydrolase MptA [Thermoplasmata archaeon]|nr:GTP cyclohydrolase MptA [Thermoplasmata archaeon]MCI4358878.1 GTP cyclohydrolase MptA [Thermoplasmata archaeon]